MVAEVEVGGNICKLYGKCDIQITLISQYYTSIVVSCTDCFALCSKKVFHQLGNQGINKNRQWNKPLTFLF